MIHSLNNRLINFFVGLIAIFLTVLGSIYHPLAILLMGFILMIVLMLKRKLIHFSFLALISVIAFLPSGYVSLLRVSTPLGQYRPSLLLGIIMFVCISLYVYAKRKDGLFEQPTKGIQLLLIAYFIIAVISAVYNSLGFNEFLYSIYALVNSLVLFTLAYSITKFINPHILIRNVVGISLIVSVIGIVEFFGFQLYGSLYQADNPSFYYAVDSSSTGMRRVVSTIGNPLVLSGFLLISLPFILYLRRTAKKKIFWNLAVILNVATIIITQSRSALLIMTLIIVIFSFKNVVTFIRNGYIVTFALMIIMLILNVMGYLESFKKRLLFQTEGESIGLRADAFDSAISMLSIMPNPLIGIGTNQISEKMYQTGLTEMMTLDNTFLTVLVSEGILGFLMLVILSLVLLKKALTTSKQLRPLSMSLVLVFVGMSFSFNMLSYDAMWGMLWIALGLLVGLENKIKADTDSTVR